MQKLQQILIKETISFHISVMIFCAISLLILPFHFSFLCYCCFLILYIITVEKLLKNRWYLLCILPSLTRIYHTRHIPSSMIVTYEITNQYKNHLYGIKLLNSYGNKTLFLKSRNKKEYFIQYKSEIYLLKNGFAVEKVPLKERASPFSLRQLIFHRIHNYVGIHASILMAILIGIKNTPYNHLFKDTGTWHLLCVGGLHMNILRGLLEFLFKCLGEVFKNVRILWKVFTYVEILFLYIYAYISNFHVPALRSLLMNVISKFFHIKKTSIPTTVSFFGAFLLLLTYNSEYLYDLGFQMSFLCVYFLITFSNLFRMYLSTIKNTYLKYFLNLLLMNFGISIVMLPFSLCLHGCYNPLGVLCNVVTIPIFSLVLCLSFMGLLHNIFWQLMHIPLMLIIHILNWSQKYNLKIFIKIEKVHIHYYAYGVCCLLILMSVMKYMYVLRMDKEKQQKLNEVLDMASDNIF